MIVTIDFETTGFTAGVDEVLQVSIIDENYNTLLNTYCRPNNSDSWEDAQRVHGITPLMVMNELPFERKEICFRNGYGSSRPEFIAECSLDIKTGREEWGAEKGKEYYTLKIHQITERSGC